MFCARAHFLCLDGDAFLPNDSRPLNLKDVDPETKQFFSVPCANFDVQSPPITPLTDIDWYASRGISPVSALVNSRSEIAFKSSWRSCQSKLSNALCMPYFQPAGLGRFMTKEATWTMTCYVSSLGDGSSLLPQRRLRTSRIRPL